MKISRSIIIIIISILSVNMNGQSNQVELDNTTQFVQNFLTNNNQKNEGVTKNVTDLFSNDSNIPNTYLFQILPKGFVIVSQTIYGPSIIAYSFENNFVELSTPDANIALEIVKEIAVTNFKNTASQNKKEIKETEEYGPYVYTMWGQVNCYDNSGQLINVTNSYTPNHYAAGCVSISQIMVMHHYCWPPRGNGAHGYTDNSGSSRGYYAANYGESYYDWSMMLERYRSKESTLAQREAVGDLTFDVAISLFMDFEPDGSTSNVNRVPTSFANYFRFTSLYRDRYASSFWSLLESNIKDEKPAILAVSGSPGGHSVVCDGLKTEDNQTYYHLNMGWWGASNGWYKIRSSFNAGEYTVIDGAAMNITPEPYVLTPDISSDSSATKLQWMYPQKANAEAFEVQVSIDNGNWQTLTSSLTDTSYNLAPNINKSYKYRVRAKTNGIWFSNSWSNTVTLHINYTDINETPESTIKVYPNPSSDIIKINFDNMNNAESIEVFNISGKSVYSEKLNKNGANHIIDVADWEKGIYIIKVSNKHNYFLSKVIIK